MVRKVWFQLVDEKSRRAFASTAASTVNSADVKDVDDLRNELQAEFVTGRAILARVSRRIYANRTAYDAMKKPLESSTAVVGLGEDKNGALIVELTRDVLNTLTTIFGTAFDNGLYIRQEYWDLHEIIQKRLALDSSLRRIFVIGSLGIGKSVIGVFLLLLFMMEKKHIAYRPLAHPQVHYCT